MPMQIPTIVEPTPPALSKSFSSISKLPNNSDGHVYRRVFIGPMPEKVVVTKSSDAAKRKKRRFRVGSVDDDDEHVSHLIREHAFAFFIQQGGNEEDWEETREQSVRYAVLFGAILLL
jgi:hypothetical protein